MTEDSGDSSFHDLDKMNSSTPSSMTEYDTPTSWSNLSAALGYKYKSNLRTQRKRHYGLEASSGSSTEDLSDSKEENVITFFSSLSGLTDHGDGFPVWDHYVPPKTHRKVGSHSRRLAPLYTVNCDPSALLKKDYSKRPAELDYSTLYGYWDKKHATHCYGCHSPLPISFFSAGNYCYYTGKNYCNNCHSEKEHYIPAKIVLEWDFSLYPVCNSAFDLIEKSFSLPILDLSKNPIIYKESPLLSKLKSIREKLTLLADFTRSCKTAQEQFLSPMANQLHLIDTVHLYSISDLVRLDKENLLEELKEYRNNCMKHIVACQSCRGKGDFCELCGKEDLLFVFQIHKITICKCCQARFHTVCAKQAPRGPDPTLGATFQGNSGCPRCVRRWKFRNSTILS